MPTMLLLSLQWQPALKKPRQAVIGNPYPLSMYLPQNKNGSILVTTRTRNVATELTEESDIIPIDLMNNVSAEALLEKKLGEQVDKDCTAELATALEFMPLAVGGIVQTDQLRDAGRKL